MEFVPECVDTTTVVGAVDVDDVFDVCTVAFAVVGEPEDCDDPAAIDTEESVVFDDTVFVVAPESVDCDDVVVVVSDAPEECDSVVLIVVGRPVGCDDVVFKV